MTAGSYDPIYTAAGQSWGVDPALLKSVAQVESSGNVNTPDSSAGAQGLMQVMPATGQQMGMTDPHDPVQNIYAGAKYLSQMLDRYKSPDLAVAAYNAGPGRVDDYLSGKAALPTETLNYVPKVAANYKQFAAADTGVRSDAAPAAAQSPAADPFAQAMAAATSASASPSASAQNALPASDPFSMAMAAANKASQGTAPAAANSNTPDAPAAPRAASDGVLSSLFAGLTHGAEAIPDTLRKAGAYVDQNVPALASLDQAAGTDALVSPARMAQQNADLAAYQARYGNSNAAMAGNIAGNVLMTAPIAGVAAAGLRGAAGLGADLVGDGTLAGRTMVAGANALTGAGKAMLPARIAASVPAGALFGGGNALLSAGQSNQPVGDQVAQGIELGAALGPVGLAIGGGARLLGKAAGATGNLLLDAYAPRSAPAVQAAAAPVTQAATSTGNSLMDQLFAEHEAEQTGRPYTPPAALAAPAPATPPQNALQAAATAGSAPPTASAAPAAASTPGNPLLAAAQPAQAIPTAMPKAGALPPLTQSAAEARADEILQHFAKGGSLDVDAAPLIPGSTPTLAQSIVGGNAGLATLERTMQAQAPQAFDTLQQAANAGRTATLAKLIGTPADLDAAEALRDAQTSAARNSAFANPAPQDAAPIANQVQGFITANNGRPSVQGPLQRVMDQLDTIAPAADDGTRMANPAELYNVRKYLNDMVAPRAAGTADDGKAAAAQLLQLKPTMDNVIEAGAPGFKNYMGQFENLSRPIDGMSYLQSLNLTDASGNTTLQKLDTAVKGLVRNQSKNGVQLADSVTPDQAGVLTALRDDMRRQALSGRGKGIGSDTTQKLATNALLSAVGGTDAPTAMGAVGGALGGAFLSPVTGGLALLGAGGRYALGAANHRAENMVREALVARLTNPALGARSLAPLRAAAAGGP